MYASALNLVCGFNGAGLGQHLAALNVLTLGAAQQGADVVAGFTAIQQLTEHFDAGDGGLHGGLQTNDFDFGRPP